MKSLACISLIYFGSLFSPTPIASPHRMAADSAFVFFNALDSAAIPKKISQTGIFRDILAKTVNAGITRFEINSALWSDGAFKIRYFILPEDSQITYRDDSAYSFPKGTVLVKNFLIDTIQGEATSRIYLETRLLIKQNSDDSATVWYGFSYRWNRDQMDAELVNPLLGMETSITTYSPNRQPVQKKWSFPSQAACWRCHMSGGRQVLGFYTAELNRPSFAQPNINQLQAFVSAGVFRGNSFPDFSQSHRWAALSDTTQSLERRARSYLAVNCSFCHSAEGRRVIGTVLSAVQDFDYFKTGTPINYLNQAAKFDYGIPNSLLLYGGNTDKSIIHYRMKDRGLDKMPPLATAEPDTLALRVVSEWISTLPSPANVGILNREISVGHRGEVQLMNGQGQKVTIKTNGMGQYRLPTDLVPGIYFLKVPGAAVAILLPYFP